MSKNSSKLGLYVHIPFCSFQCHYCDFAKTANWDQALLTGYVCTLNLHMEVWLNEFVNKRGYTIDTLFFGGGTPGLLAGELQPLFETLSRFGVHPEEITLECNPENINEEKLKIWKDLGVNRLSIGVQSFQAEGLRVLTRQHTPEQLHRSLDLACRYFENISCDLIYAWPGQSLALWQSDLATVQKFPLTHLSLYCLTYEERTPFGRTQRRKPLDANIDEFQEECYLLASRYLEENHWDHYECSNWARSGKISVHNAKYWQDQYFIGVGVGACGYIPDGAVGLRYAYQRKERPFTKEPPPLSISYRELPHCEFEDRSPSDWLTEYVGCGLRYREGIDLALIASKVGARFVPKGLVATALADGRLQESSHRLYLHHTEWIRETRWCLEVLKSFV